MKIITLVIWTEVHPILAFTEFKQSSRIPVLFIRNRIPKHLDK